MAGFPKFKTRDEVPEAFRPFYEDKAGEWVAKEDELGEGGTKALQRERTARETAEKATKAAEDKARIAEEQAAALKAGISAEDAKKFREDTEKSIRAEFQGQIDTLTGENTSLQLDHKVKAMALKAGVLPERIDDWWALNGSGFQLDSKREPEVKDGKGKPVAEFIAGDLKKARPYLYAGTKGDGGGAGGTSTTTTPQGDGKLTYEQVMKNPAAALGSKS